MKELAARLHCDPSSVTFLVGRLDRLGLIGRTPDQGDRRSTTVHLTAHGRAVRQRLLDAMTHHTPLSTLSAADQQAMLDLPHTALAQPDGADDHD